MSDNNNKFRVLKKGFIPDTFMLIGKCDICGTVVEDRAIIESSSPFFNQPCPVCETKILSYYQDSEKGKELLIEAGFFPSK